jgi:hypothetical protein
MAIVNRYPGVGVEMKSSLASFGRLPQNVKFFSRLKDAERWLAE